MKRNRRVVVETTKRIRIVLQVNLQRGKLKRGYETLTIGSIHKVVSVPSSHRKYGEWIIGTHGYPVFIYSHELKYLAPERITRTRRKPIKVKRVRTKKPKIKRRRKY